MADQGEQTGQAPQDRGLVSRIGPVKVDWPRSIGYYGGIGIAVAAGAIEPPLAIFIAAIPFLKMLNRPKASQPVRFIGQVLDGASKPVGGSSEATIELATAGEASAPQASAPQASPSQASAPQASPSQASPSQASPSQAMRPTMWQEARQLADRIGAGKG